MNSHTLAKGLDVIVVGGGVSGICAAVSAAENGASVVVLDRAFGGGASAISGGVVYAGGGTRHQVAAGFDDTPDNMFRYLRREVGDAVDETTLRSFCNQSVASIEWLETHGVRFSGTMVPYKTSYPTGEYHLHYSGNEKANPWASLAKPAPRGHRTVGQGLPGMEMTGASLWQSLFDSAVGLGVGFIPASRVHRLLVDDRGKVQGVQYRALGAAGPGWVVALYKWLTNKAKKYRGTFQYMSNALDCVADVLWTKYARDESLEARAVILAAGGFVSMSKLFLSTLFVSLHAPADTDSTRFVQPCLK